MLAMVGAMRTASADVPAWCKQLGLEHDWARDLEEAIHQDDTRALTTLINLTCRPDDRSKAKDKELGEARARWSKRLDLTDADWADAAAWTGSDNTLIPSPPDKLAWSTLNPIDQYRAIQFAESSRVETNVDYIADAFGQHLTETGRFGYIEACVSRKDDAAHWAMCQGDLDQFDPKKMVAELRSDTTHKPYERFVLRLKLDGFGDMLKKHAAALKDLFAKDSAYKKIFDVAAQARKDWSNTDAALADLVLQMDDARATNSRKAYDGCIDKTWPAFQAAVATIPAKAFANVKDEHDKLLVNQYAEILAATPNGYLASVALAWCMHGLERGDRLTGAIRDATNYWPGFRGPRTAAQSALYQTAIVFDDRDTKFSPGEVRHNWQIWATDTNGTDEGTAVVAKVTTKGEVTTIAFTKQSGKQTHCTNYKESTKIRGFDSAGGIVYEGTCLKEETETIDMTHDPLPVNTRYIAGVKPGVVVHVMKDVVEVVFPKAGAKVPSYVLGVAVK
jgi:hypothetical protein